MSSKFCPYVDRHCNLDCMACKMDHGVVRCLRLEAELKMKDWYVIQLDAERADLPKSPKPPEVR